MEGKELFTDLQEVTVGVVLLGVVYSIVVKKILLPTWLYEEIKTVYREVITKLTNERDEAHNRLINMLDPPDKPKP